MSFRARAVAAGFSASTAFGSVVAHVPALDKRLFGPIDMENLRIRSKLRTLPALWNLRAMMQLDVPWWTWGSIAEVESFLRARPAPRVFEWGSGASTCWLARRCASVTSVEHHEAFAAAMRTELVRFPNVRLIERHPSSLDGSATPPPIRSQKSGNQHLDFTAYVHAIDSEERFDLIVVDGRARSACLERAVEHLADDGMLVLDNSDRLRYAEALDAAARGHTMRRFHGYGPASPLPSETTVITFG